MTSRQLSNEVNIIRNLGKTVWLSGFQNALHIHKVSQLNKSAVLVRSYGSQIILRIIEGHFVSLSENQARNKKQEQLCRLLKVRLIVWNWGRIQKNPIWP